MSEVATFLKVASTAMLLSAAEDNPDLEMPAIASPVRAMTQVSHDPSLAAAIQAFDGTTIRAIDVQWQLFDIARTWFERTGGEAVGEEDCALALQHWERILAGLEHDPRTVADSVDWVAKHRLISAYAERHQLEPGAAALRVIDLQYHDMRRHKGLARRCGLVTLASDEQVSQAMTSPPNTTRAFFRGRCIERFPDEVLAANWDSMVFDLGADPLRRVPMDDPLRGTAELVANVIANSATAKELVAALAEPNE
jgi:proteasome accessory factor A